MDVLLYVYDEEVNEAGTQTEATSWGAELFVQRTFATHSEVIAT